MITNYKGSHPTDEEIWAMLPQEAKDKIMSGYVEGFRMKEEKTMKTTKAIKLTFKETGGSAYFGSVAAIYEAYNREDLGITLQSLWQHKLPYENKLVRVERIEIKHKPQQNKRK